MKTCQHCSRETRLTTRGLCKPCYNRLEIRNMYTVEDHADDMTWEEVERIVAEQLPTMPRHDERTGGRGPRHLPHALSFGRGIDAAKFRNKPRRSNWA